MDETLPDNQATAPLSPTVHGLQAHTRLFDRFELIRKLGQGGMGVVWLARDHRLDHDVALKFLPDAVRFDHDAIADLKRETQRALKLTHPNIVRIHDLEQTDDLVCISMEYVNGRSLSEVKAQRGCLEVDDIRPWLPSLLDALRYAHESARLIHRDLKPANLMLTQDGELKVTDFGIARSVADSVSRVSMSRLTSGTPAYASPQQMHGDTPSPADDIYALGATLFDLLTGRPPFFRGDIIAQAHAVTPPSVAERRAEFNLGTAPIPAEWEDAIAACLAKERTARPASVRELGARLSGSAAPIPPPPKLPPSPSPAPTPAPARKTSYLLAWIGIPAAAVLAVGIGIALRSLPDKTVKAATPTPIPAPIPVPTPVAVTAGRLLKEAMELRRRGALRNARERLHAALALDPGNAEVRSEIEALDRAAATPPPSPTPVPPIRPVAGPPPVRMDLIKQITASSTLPSQVDESGRRNAYGVRNAIDGDVTTAWVGARGSSDLRVNVAFTQPVLVSRISIYPGYGKSRTAFTRNNRVRDFSVVFADGRQERFTCEDRMEMQSFNLPKVAATTDGLTITVLSVYGAEKFTGDTPISEIGFQ